jgi:GTPase
VVVQIVDGKAGPNPLDYAIAERLRRSNRPTVLLVNKVDNLGAEGALQHHDFWDLGVGEPYPLSSLSGKGSGDVLDAIVAHLPEITSDEEPDEIRIAVVGVPNVGKSSFVNRLLGEERLVVSDVAGTTRDAIDTPMQYQGQRLVFIDTAGLRRQSRVKESVEFYSGIRTEHAIERADVCILLTDATESIHHQDLRIAQMAWDAGCGLIIVANKWDLVEKETMTAPKFEKALHEKAPFLEWVPVLFTSALTGQRVQKVLELVLEVEAEREKRIPTHEVNEVLKELTSRARPPQHQGHPVKFYYATQVAVRPPTMVLWSNLPEAVPESYVRFLHNGMRAKWGFLGSPLRINLRRRGEEE